jgi:branched-chain amino acid aminotransferase
MDELQVSVNGRLTPASRAAVSVFDAGLLHGASVFTTMLARGGRVFRLDRHLARLMETARMLGLRVQPPADSPPAGAAAVRGDSVGAKSSA